jgi:hypothetical protein
MSRTAAYGCTGIQPLSWVNVPKFRPAGGPGKLFGRPVDLVPKESLHTETSGVRIVRPGGIKQVKIPFDRIPQFVLRVAVVATVFAPPALIPVLVADLAKMGQRRAQVLPELQPLIGRLRDQPLQ